MSRSAACALFAAWVSFVACAAVPVFADDGVGSPTAEATAAADAAPAAPVIEVVREGGVAEAWREEGSAFATYGPDGEAVVPTPERQALQALANAYDVQFVALRGPGPGCADGCLGDCVGGLPVADRIAGDTIARYALARELAGAALGEARPGGVGGDFGHALTFSADGHAWELLLCFDCGRYALRRDGEPAGGGEFGGEPDRAAFDALLSGDGSDAG